MTLSLAPASRPLQGRVTLPGDKSLAHRAALFAALAEGTSTVRNYPDSGVTRAMRGALESFGVPSRLEDGVLILWETDSVLSRAPAHWRTAASRA